MKSTQKIPLVFILAVCLILSCIPAFADDANTPGFGTPDSGAPVLHSIHDKVGEKFSPTFIYSDVFDKISNNIIKS